MTLAEALGREVRAEAAAQRVTIAQLATRAGVNRSSLYTWLDGQVAFPLQGLEALSSVLGVAPHQMVRRAEARARGSVATEPA